MKRLISLGLAGLILAVFLFQLRSLLAKAPEGGGPLLWILAFAIIVGLMSLLGRALRAFDASRLAATLRSHPKLAVTMSPIFAFILFILAKPYPILSPFILGLLIVAVAVFIGYFSWLLLLVPIRLIKNRG